MNVRIAQFLSFNAGSWYDDTLEMNQYNVKLWMITQTENSLEQNIAFRRAKHFIINELDSTIFLDAGEEEKCAEFTRAGLNITTLPGDPADQLIGIMLFHKINAVMEDRIRLLEIEISAGDSVVYLHGENETSDELIQPDWWHNPDLTHSDYVPVDTDKVVSIPQSTAWRELFLSWPDEEPTKDNSGNVVVFANFKPADDTE